MRGPGDEQITRAHAEVQWQLAEPVQIQRVTGTSGGDPARGTKPTETKKTINTKAVIEELESREIYYPGSIFQVGDVRAQFIVPIYGGETYSGDNDTPRQADDIIYRGRKYQVIGTVNRLRLNNRRSHFEAVLRRQA